MTSRTISLLTKRKAFVHMLRKFFRERLLKRPTQAIIEPTNRCNLNCPYCMVGRQEEAARLGVQTSHSLMKREQGLMDRRTFERVSGQLRSFGIRRAYLHFQGEPFLNPLTPEFAGMLKNGGFEVGIFTNGMAFNDQNIREIAKAEIDLIRFSVDGASQETYSLNRVGGDFSRVIESMYKVVSAHRGKKTVVEWQFLAMSNNEHEIESARRKAQELGVRFFVKGFRETDVRLKPADLRYQAKFLRKPCTDIYHQIGIYWNGDVVPCCYDTDADEVMGNLLSQTLKEIWRCDKYKDFRKRVDMALLRPNAEPQLCRTCLRWK